jgi:hypothetical protein
MIKAISNTSPLLYLYRIGAIHWLSELFDEVWIPEAVKDELLAGRSKGYDVPNPDEYPLAINMLKYLPVLAVLGAMVIGVLIGKGLYPTSLDSETKLLHNH